MGTPGGVNLRAISLTAGLYVFGAYVRAQGAERTRGDSYVERTGELVVPLRCLTLKGPQQEFSCFLLEY